MQIADNLLTYFASQGCDLPEIGLLQPADPLLDTAGEDLRRRIFITAGQKGESLCLRPEFTIPACLHYLREGTSGKARFGYAGTVFRQRSNEASEFLQAGIEDIGNPDRLTADLAAVTDCCEAIRLAGVSDYRLVIGDQAIFEAVLSSLGLPAAWQKRLGRSFGDMARMSEDLDRLSGENKNGLGLDPELAEMAVSGESELLNRKIAGMMEEAGLQSSMGRTPEEITERILEKAELAAANLDADHRVALDAFLALETSIEEAPAVLEQTASLYDFEMGSALEGFSALVDALKTRKISNGESIYKASFGRRLDYYTGLVFEIECPGQTKPVAGGGRYDHLMSLLGAEAEIPAVGFSIWLDRLAAAGGQR